MKKCVVFQLVIVLIVLIPAAVCQSKTFSQSFRVSITLPEHVLIPEQQPAEMQIASLSLKSEEVRFMVIQEELVREGKRVEMKTIVVR